MLIEFYDKEGEMIESSFSVEDYRPKKGTKKNYKNKIYEVVDFDYKSENKYVKYLEM